MNATDSAVDARLALRRRVAIAAIFFVNGFAFASWVPHIPTVQTRLGISAGALGLALLAVAIGALVSMPLTGIFLGKWGSSRVTLVSSVLFCALIALPVRAPSLPLFVLSLFALGAINGAMDVAMNAHGVVVERWMGRPILSSLHAMFSLGGLVGAGCSMVVLKSGFSPAAHMAGAAVGGVLLVGAAARWLGPGSAGSAGSTPMFVLPRGPLLFLGGLSFFVLLTEGAVADWSAVYLRHSLHADPHMAGAGYAVFSLTMTAGRLVGDRLAATFSPVTLLRTGGLLAAGGLGAALLLNHPLAAVVGFGCMGVGLSNIIPLMFSAAGRTPGIPSGMAIASMSTAGYGGFLAGPPLVGFVADVVGLPLALGMLVVFLSIVAASAGWMGTSNRMGEPQVDQPAG
ncbi:MFS transporter [Vitiosangium sp. GDMCC 1.1324]|uniref:MFS transporter n=1 Tax=Vitiosangium sp. (strain GDMCC 1.1324) TaxID=2138576 RepID=UPI000D35F2D8|nr:MFS transporter [Vitiosangium sp. GDMCC 1.1324]PTL83640.1 MFS transporter [Vitiosangium sp. GDMCC 1.1324]